VLDWLNDNWGNVASVLGLLLAMPSLWLSIWALRMASTARDAVARFRRKQRARWVATELGLADLVIDGLLTARAGTSLKALDCDRLRKLLVGIRSQDSLKFSKPNYLSRIISWLAQPIRASDETRISLRELQNELDAARRTVVLELEDDQ